MEQHAALSTTQPKNYYYMYRTILLWLFCCCMLPLSAAEAKWITADDSQANRPNTWIAFQKDIVLKKKPGRMMTKIACDSKVLRQVGLLPRRQWQSWTLHRCCRRRDRYQRVVGEPHPSRLRNSHGQGAELPPARKQHLLRCDQRYSRMADGGCTLQIRIPPFDNPRGLGGQAVG